MRRGRRGIRMTYQITLHDGDWKHKVTERSVRNQIRQHFPRSRSQKERDLDTHTICFNTPDEGVLISAELTLDERSIYRNDEELCCDKLYTCFYALEPEYESMVEITLEK